MNLKNQLKIVIAFSIVLGRATLSLSLYKLEFFIVKYEFLSLFGVGSIKKMVEYSDLMTKKLLLI